MIMGKCTSIIILLYCNCIQIAGHVHCSEQLAERNEEIEGLLLKVESGKVHTVFFYSIQHTIIM